LGRPPLFKKHMTGAQRQRRYMLKKRALERSQVLTAEPAEVTDQKRSEALPAIVAIARHGDAAAKSKLDQPRNDNPALYEILASSTEPAEPVLY
jgi:hypothetical protein